MSKGIEKALERAKHERDKHQDNPILQRKHHDLVLKLEKKLNDKLRVERKV